MKDSTKRALRTAYHTVVALVVALPVLLASLPDTVKGPSIVVAVAVVSKIINALEDSGVLPAWLKSDTADSASVA